MQTIAEVMTPVPCGADEIGFAAIAEVEPGGHFFSAAHTMARYAGQFYRPLVSDWSNFGQWTEGGSRTATERAAEIAARVLDAFEPPALDPARLEALDEFVARRTATGGAPPV